MLKVTVQHMHSAGCIEAFTGDIYPRIIYLI